MLKNFPLAKTEPLVLIIPGLDNSGADHWQTHWERKLPHAERVDLGSWDDPRRNTWVNRLNLAIHKARRPVILVAHSLACHVVAWWNEYERPEAGGPVVGALLVAPPEAEQGDVDPRIARFGPVLKTPLPFPSILVASRDDHYIGFDRARRLARIWRSRFIDGGWVGHINADSGIRDWPFGQYLLRQLRAAAEPVNQPLRAGRNYELLLNRGQLSAAW